jgi:hypothetical protein
VDLASLAGILAEPHEYKDPSTEDVDSLLEEALSSYHSGTYWKALITVKQLTGAMDRKRAEWIGSFIPEELPVWGGWSSGGMGGYPASVSRLFRSDGRMLIVLVTENREDFPELSPKFEGGREIEWNENRGVQYFHPEEKRWRLVFPLKGVEAALLIIGDGVEASDLRAVLPSLDIEKITRAVQK